MQTNVEKKKTRVSAKKRGSAREQKKQSIQENINAAVNAVATYGAKANS